MHNLLQTLPSLFFHISPEDYSKYLSNKPQRKHKPVEIAKEHQVDDLLLRRLRHWLPKSTHVLQFQNPYNNEFFSCLLPLESIYLNNNTLLLDIANNKNPIPFQYTLLQQISNNNTSNKILIAKQQLHVTETATSSGTTTATATATGITLKDVIGNNLRAQLLSSSEISYEEPTRFLKIMETVAVANCQLETTENKTKLSFQTITKEYTTLFTDAEVIVDRYPVFRFNVKFMPERCTLTLDFEHNKVSTVVNGSCILTFTKGRMFGEAVLLLADCSLHLIGSTHLKLVMNAGEQNAFIFPSQFLDQRSGSAAATYLKMDESLSQFIFHKIIIESCGEEPKNVQMIFKKDNTQSNAVSLGYRYHDCKAVVINHEMRLFVQLFDKFDFMEVDINELTSFGYGRFRNVRSDKTTLILSDSEKLFTLEEIGKIPDFISTEVGYQLEQARKNILFLSLLKAKIIGFQMLPSAQAFITLETLPLVYNVPFAGQILISSMILKVTATGYSFEYQKSSRNDHYMVVVASNHNSNSLVFYPRDLRSQYLLLQTRRRDFLKAHVKNTKCIVTNGSVLVEQQFTMEYTIKSSVLDDLFTKAQKQAKQAGTTPPRLLDFTTHDSPTVYKGSYILRIDNNYTEATSELIFTKHHENFPPLLAQYMRSQLGELQEEFVKRRDFTRSALAQQNTLLRNQFRDITVVTIVTEEEL